MNKIFSSLMLTGLLSLCLLFNAQVQAKTVVLRALMEDVPETKIIENLLPEFEKKYHIKVQFEKVGYGDMHDKLVSQLISPQSYYNLLEVDFLWAGEFSSAGWLTNLSPMIDKSKFDMAGFIPSMVSLLNIDSSKTNIIPMYNYSMGLIYRTDLLQNNTLKKQYQAKFGRPLSLPENLDDYVNLVKFVKKQTGIAGVAMQGQRGDPNSMEFSNYLFSTGGNYIDDKRQVTLNNEQGRIAMTKYADAIKNGAQFGAMSATLNDTYQLMCSGKAFSMVSYWWMLPQLDDKTACPNIAGKVALSTMPGGHGESGGWGWGIPKNATLKEKAAAWTFIQWVQSKKVSVQRALKGHAPVSTAIFRHPDVLAKYPYYAEAEKIVVSGKSFPIFTYTAQYEDQLGTLLSKLSGGEITVDEALNKSASQLKALMNK